jgi:hypothetical protein
VKGNGNEEGTVKWSERQNHITLHFHFPSHFYQFQWFSFPCQFSLILHLPPHFRLHFGLYLTFTHLISPYFSLFTFPPHFIIHHIPLSSSLLPSSPHAFVTAVGAGF